MENALVSWSSGKDSALALYYVLKQKKFNPIGLLTTISEESKRIDFHELPETLLEAQAESLELPLHRIHLPSNCTNTIYESTLRKHLTPFLNQEISHILFGDLFLVDIRSYRETLLASIPLKAVFPLWGISTQSLAQEIIQLGFKAVIVAVDTSKLPSHLLGKRYDSAFLNELPPTIDPCGENGEFHTFVYAGPIFKKPVPFTLGKVFGTKKTANIDVLPQI